MVCLQFWNVSTGFHKDHEKRLIVGRNFVGCCARNPCTTMCAYGDLYQAGFNAAAHGTFPDASCGASVSVSPLVM
jgi:hypothetical protein